MPTHRDRPVPLGLKGPDVPGPGATAPAFETGSGASSCGDLLAPFAYPPTEGLPHCGGADAGLESPPPPWPGETHHALTRTPVRSSWGEPSKTVVLCGFSVAFDVRGRDVMVGTGNSPQGEPVAIDEVQAGLLALATQGRVRVNPATLGYRSAFVGAILYTVPGAIIQRDPQWVELTDSHEVPEPTSFLSDVRDHQGPLGLAVSTRIIHWAALKGANHPAGMDPGADGERPPRVLRDQPWVQAASG